MFLLVIIMRKIKIKKLATGLESFQFIERDHCVSVSLSIDPIQPSYCFEALHCCVCEADFSFHSDHLWIHVSLDPDHQLLSLVERFFFSFNSFLDRKKINHFLFTCFEDLSPTNFNYNYYE